MDVLLIAFGRFPGAPFNPTPDLVARLVRRRRPRLAGLNRVAHVLPVSYAGIARDVPRLIACHRPDIVLMFGLAARTPHLRIETRAQNALSLLFPDAEGRRAARKAIDGGAVGARRGRAPHWRLLRAVRARGLPVRLSRDAGRYICNLAYWHALGQADGALVQFVHVPNVRRSARPRARSGRRQLTPGELVAAGEAILLTLAAAARSRR